MLRDGQSKPFLSVLEQAVRTRQIPSQNFASYNAFRKDCKDKSQLCYAPATNLYFGRDGIVSACCYSRDRPLGQYPAMSIDQIWFGQPRFAFREDMQHMLLPPGCHKCGDQLRAGNHSGLIASTYDRFALSPAEFKIDQARRKFGVAPKEPYPLSFEFELSNKCNLECKMCCGFCSSLIRANRDRLPAFPQLYDDAFLQQLRPYIPHLRKVTFIGGEPFLIDLYYEIWELFIELNPKCEMYITTNGTVFTAKVQRILEKLNCRITVSIDSTHKATYELVRKNATLETTLANIARFKEINDRRGQKMTVNTCPIVSTWQYIPDLVAWASASGLTVFFSTVFFPQDESLMYLPAEEQRRIAAHLRRGTGQPTSEIAIRNARTLEDLASQVESWTAGSSHLAESVQRLHSISF